jgi:hypothetical protein
MTPELHFQMIAQTLSDAHDDVEAGKMMSSPAITFRGKVFAFIHDGMITFKLGEMFEPESMGIDDYQLLAPFKSKPPMRAWFSIPEQEHWQKLALQALERMKVEVA